LGPLGVSGGNVDRKVKLFVSYAHADAAHVQILKMHLGALSVWQDRLSVWWDGEIRVGTSWDSAIASALDEAQVVVFLVTADLVSSDYVRRVEVAQALERHGRDECEIVPVRVRDVDVEGTPFSSMQWTPRGAPIVGRTQRDRAWKEVAECIRGAVVRREAHFAAINQSQVDKSRKDPPEPDADRVAPVAPIISITRGRQPREAVPTVVRLPVVELLDRLAKADFTHSESWAVASLRHRSLRADLASSAAWSDIPPGWASNALRLVDAIDALGSDIEASHRREAARVANVKKRQLTAIGCAIR
jgi:hypothetical protein